MNHYQLLGVSSQASLREVRSAYFSLSKRFHPDAFFRKEIGGYRKKLESVFDALTGAYETLRKTGTRGDYDDSIGLPQALRAAPEATRSSRPPGARIESEFDRVQREVERRTPSMAPPPTHAVPPAPPGPPVGSPPKAPSAGRAAPSPANTNATAKQAEAPASPSKPAKPRSSKPPKRSVEPPKASDRARPAAASDRARPASSTSDRARAAHNPPAPRQMQEMGPSTRSKSTPSSLRDASAKPEAGETRGTGTGPRPSNQGARPSQRPAAAKAPSSPGAVQGSSPNPFEEGERRSTLLRELDQLMQQRLQQGPPPSSPGTSGAARASSPPPGFGAPSTGNFGAPGTGNLGAPSTGTFGAPATGTTGQPTGTTSLAPDPASASKPPGGGPSLLEIADQLQGGTGLSNWAAQRLREAYHEEQAGHVVDAANIVRIVLNQFKDPQVETQSQRLSRLVAAKTAPAQKMRARAAERDGLWKEAAECWAKVREGCPNDALAAYNHARTLMQAGDLKSAGRAGMRAAELAPEHVETRELLIEFFEKMGMKLNARRERDTVQKLLEAKAKAPKPK
jgi:curved DNA-binding protein CbpA